MTDFEKLVLPHLEATRGEEATRVVLELWDGRGLEDAVPDAIESLPHTQTRKHRGWVSQHGAVSDWRDLARRGWWVARAGKGFGRPFLEPPGARVFVGFPKGSEQPGGPEVWGVGRGIREAVAAAIGARRVKLADMNLMRGGFYYEVEEAW